MTLNLKQASCHDNSDTEVQLASCQRMLISKFVAGGQALCQDNINIEGKVDSVSARMHPCGIPANKLGFPHISKHGTPDLALTNHIRRPKIDLPVYDRAKVQKYMGRNFIAYEN